MAKYRSHILVTAVERRYSINIILHMNLGVIANLKAMHS